jgi:UDP-N-acetylglucosamine diphosphorylase/glucosamine-1-phosphate N-acetyltransferase
MNIVFFEDHSRADLLPLTYTRPVSHIRIGILTIKEKWQQVFTTASFSDWTEVYLQEKHPLKHTEDTIYINANTLPDPQLINAISNLKSNDGLTQNNSLLAYRGKVNTKTELTLSRGTAYVHPVLQILNVWDIFQKNGEALKRDFEMLTKGRVSQPLSESNTVIGDKHLIFLEPGAVCEAAVLNTKNGPVYLGNDTEVMEGSVIRGPFALCEHSATKLSTKIYGPTTVGPHSKVGGEINNSVIFGFSNKAHDGFLGNSVLGEWCNLGADTNNSNLKNNYANVKVYNYRQQKMVDSGLQFCGLIMGDHSKTGINTMLNTGTVVGVACNIYGGSFPPTHIPSFQWGGAEKLETYQFDKFIETAERVYERRGLKLDDIEKKLLKVISDTKS